MISRKAPLLLALPLILAACGGEPAPQESEAGTAASGTNPAIERYQDARIIVNANGFAALEGEPLRFGTARADVDALAAKAFGAAGKQSENAECGAGPMAFTQHGPLQIAYQDGKFVGWFLGEGKGAITSDGITTGIPLTALKAERPVRVITDSTLEGEFEYQTADAGMITGFFKGSQNDGTIVALQAGLNCFFR